MTYDKNLEVIMLINFQKNMGIWNITFLMRRMPLKRDGENIISMIMMTVSQSIVFMVISLIMYLTFTADVYQ